MKRTLKVVTNPMNAQELIDEAARFPEPASEIVDMPEQPSETVVEDVTVRLQCLLVRLRVIGLAISLVSLGLTVWCLHTGLIVPLWFAVFTLGAALSLVFTGNAIKYINN